MSHPSIFFCFVDLENESLIVDSDDYFTYWESEHETISVVKEIMQTNPNLPAHKYGIAKVFVTKTEYTKERSTLYHNIEVIHYFKDVI